MEWAKLHTDILADPKLLRAARKGVRHLEFTPWLFAFARLVNDDGRLTVGGAPAEALDIAPMIPGANEDAIAGCIAGLVGLGILVPDRDRADVLCFRRWERRQAKPSAAADAIAARVERHREKQRGTPTRNGNTPAAKDVTPHRNTPPALPVTPGHQESVTPPRALQPKYTSPATTYTSPVIGNSTEITDVTPSGVLACNAPEVLHVTRQKRREEKRREEKGNGPQQAVTPPTPAPNLVQNNGVPAPVGALEGAPHGAPPSVPPHRKAKPIRRRGEPPPTAGALSPPDPDEPDAQLAAERRVLARKQLFRDQIAEMQRAESQRAELERGKAPGPAPPEPVGPTYWFTPDPPTSAVDRPEVVS